MNHEYRVVHEYVALVWAHNTTHASWLAMPERDLLYHHYRANEQIFFQRQTYWQFRTGVS